MNDPAATAQSAAPHPPMEPDGVPVIDVGTFLAGPCAASCMGEFGAEGRISTT